jgi:hypothetical protein
MLTDKRFDDTFPPLPKARESPRLVCFHKARVADDVRDENPGKTALR